MVSLLWSLNPSAARHLHAAPVHADKVVLIACLFRFILQI